RRVGPGYACCDAGTHDSRLEVSQFVQTIEMRQGQKIGCVEEIAYRLGHIDAAQLAQLAPRPMNSGYGDSLESLLQEGGSRQFPFAGGPADCDSGRLSHEHQKERTMKLLRYG